MQRDYYEVLSITREADDRTVKQAYRKMAMEYHPDRNDTAEAEEMFKQAAEAYEVLSDPEKRKVYDRFGHDGLRSQGFSGFSGAGVEDIFSSFGDIFGDLFGFGPRGGRRSARARGSDLRYELEVDFEEAVFGTEKQISFEQLRTCGSCDGSGGTENSRPVKCSACGGSGQVVHGQGLFLVSTTCPSCRGQGEELSDPCSECRGEGRVRGQREVTVKIPPGFEEGMSLRYGGEGEPGQRGASPGDLYVGARIRPHDRFEREGNDLISELELDMVDAALGCTLSFETLEGPEEVTVKPGAQPGDVLSLRGKGVPRLQGSGRGDLHLIYRIAIPKSLNSKQRKLLEEFRGKSPKKKKSLFS